MPVYGGVFNIFEHLLSFCKVQPQRAAIMPYPTSARISNFFMAMFLPFVTLHEVYGMIRSKPAEAKGNLLRTGVYSSLFVLWVALFACMGVSTGLRAFAWAAMMANACILCTLRAEVRAKLNIEGNIVADFFLSGFLYPQVLCQMVEELQEQQEKEIISA